VLLGVKLQRLRHRSGLSVPQLAQRSGIGKPPLYDYLANRRVPTLATLKRLASALNVRIADLNLDAVEFPTDRRSSVTSVDRP
jgi:transcriptional regulator with XRE-family HTH domain